VIRLARFARRLAPHPWRSAVALAAMLTAAGPAGAQRPDSVWTAGVRQRDVMDMLSRILGGKDSVVVEPAPKVVLAILPTFSANPAYGALFGVSANAFTRLGPEETTNASTAGASVSYTTKKQFNVVVRSNIFGNANSFLLQGDWRYLDTSQPTYGLGPAQPNSQKDELEYRLIRIYQTFFRPISGRLMGGIGYHLNYHFDIVDPNAEQGLPSPVVDYNQGQNLAHTLSSGLSLNLAFDNRDHPINPARGYYATASLRMFPTWLGTDSSWQSFQTDFRTYSQLDEHGRSVLAFWNTTWFTFGGTPYLELPAIGWDTYQRSGRGYAQGRVRGRNQIYTEGEYRLAITRDGFWGAVAFVNLIATSDPATNGFERVDPGAGLGLRIKLNNKSATNITIDFGFGAQGSNGLFLGSGEAF
jgi:hypothetical protein